MVIREKRNVQASTQYWPLRGSLLFDSWAPCEWSCVHTVILEHEQHLVFQQLYIIVGCYIKVFDYLKTVSRRYKSVRFVRLKP